MNKIKDLYGKLYDELECCFKEGKKSEDKELSTFVPMKGFRYDSEEIRLMVVGRATNGWEKEINTEQRNSFIRDAMEKLDNPCRFSWILEEKQKPEKKDRYYAEAKPFWNYTRCILEKLYGPNLPSDWYQSIVWSNLFPVSFAKEGNPSEALKKKQFEVAKELLIAQIEHFKPTHILFITNWDGWFAMNNKQFLLDFEIKTKGNRVIKGRGIFGESRVVITRRPEYFPKAEFVEEVIKTFKYLKNKTADSSHS